MRERRLRWRPRRAWAEYVLTGAMAVGLAYLVVSLVFDPTRRTITTAVGIVFLCLISALPTSVSLCVLVFLLPFGINISVGSSNMIFILMLALVVVVRRLRASEPIFAKTGIGLPMMLLLLVHAASFYHLVEEDRRVAMAKVFGLATAMIVFYLVVSVVRDLPTLRAVLTASVLGCAATCVISSYELYNPGHSILPSIFYIPFAAKAGIIRAVGPFRNYSTYAQYLGINMLVISFLMVRVRNFTARCLLAILLAVAAVIFLSSGMRGVFFSMILAVTYLGVFGRHAVKLRELGGSAAVIGLVMAVGAIFMSSVARMGTLFTRLGTLGLVGGSAEGRWEMQLYLWKRIPSHLFIGHGPFIRFPKYFGEIGSSNPHNQYMYYLYTTGIIGLGAFLWILYRLVTEGHYTLVRTRKADPFALGLLAVLQANLVLFMVHEIADDYMFHPISMHTTWFYFGLLLATARIVRETEVKPELGIGGRGG